MVRLPDRIFITGTDTGIGKTFVSAVITCGRNGYYWKPVQSGIDDMTDTQWVESVTGLSSDHFIKEVYRLKAPLSPHHSAELEGIEIDPERIIVPHDKIPLVVEGAGGVMVPLRNDFLMLDLMENMALPVLIVARSGLGTINHTLLTIDALRRRNIEIVGVVMNGVINPGNRKSIEEIGHVKVIAQIEPLTQPVNRIDSAVFKGIYRRFFSE